MVGKNPAKAPAVRGRLGRRHTRDDKDGHIVRKALPIALLLLGAASLILGWLGETVLAPDDTHTATVQLKDPGPAVVIEPGVLYAGGKEGTVTVKADGEITQIAARPADAEAYLEGTKHTAITGVPSWTELKAEPRNPDGAAELPNGGASDLWLDENKSASPFSMRIEDWKKAETASTGADAPYRSLVFITDGTKPGASEVTITWPVEQTWKWQPWALAAGAVLMIIGLVMLLLMRTRGSDEPVDAEPEDMDPEEMDPADEASAEEGVHEGYSAVEDYPAVENSHLDATTSYEPVHEATAPYEPVHEATTSYEPVHEATASYEPVHEETAPSSPVDEATAPYAPIDDATAPYQPVDADPVENPPAHGRRAARRRRTSAAELAAEAFGKQGGSAANRWRPADRADADNENPEDIR